MKKMLTTLAMTLAVSSAFAAPVSPTATMSVQEEARAYACGTVAKGSNDECLMSMFADLERAQKDMAAKPSDETRSEYLYALLPLAGALQAAPCTKTVTDITNRLRTFSGPVPNNLPVKSGCLKAKGGNEAVLGLMLETVTHAQKTMLASPTMENAFHFDHATAPLIGALAVAERTPFVIDLDAKFKVLLTEVAAAEGKTLPSFAKTK